MPLDFLCLPPFAGAADFKGYALDALDPMS